MTTTIVALRHDNGMAKLVLSNQQDIEVYNAMVTILDKYQDSRELLHELVPLIFSESYTSQDRDAIVSMFFMAEGAHSIAHNLYASICNKIPVKDFYLMSQTP